MSEYLACLDVGGTNVRIGTFDVGAGLLKDFHREPTRGDAGAPDPLRRVLSLLASVIGSTTGTCRGIAVGVPALVDRRTGLVSHCSRIPELNGSFLAADLERRFGIPALVANDAQLVTLGEHRFGAGRGYRHMVCLTIGTGVGGGVIVDHQLVHGWAGFAGEFGQLLMPAGSGDLLVKGEALVSASAIVRGAESVMAAGGQSGAGRIIGGGVLTAERVAEAVWAGAEEFRQVFDVVGHRLGVLIANILHGLNPQATIIGGGVSRAGQLILEPAQRSLRKYVLPPVYEGVDVRLAELGDEAGLKGGASALLSTGFRW